ncbi:MAG: hypothetical protein LBD72_02415 [Puniceicoccales bacterium]|nr:hypothetical protein [Puniceicoccales bacterium]
MLAFYVFHHESSTMDTQITDISYNGWQLHANGQTLHVIRVGTPSVSDVAKLRDTIWKYGYTSLEILKGDARQTALIFGVYVAIISQAPASLVWDEESPVAEVWPLFVLFNLIATTRPGPNDMITFGTSWMLGDSPIDPEALPTGTHVDPTADMQNNLLECIAAEGQSAWGCVTGDRLEILEIGGMSIPALAKFSQCFLGYPRQVTFKNVVVAHNVFAALYWGGVFIFENDHDRRDMRPETIAISLCMLIFIFKTERFTIDGTGRVIYDRLPEQCDWPNDSVWGDVNNVLQRARDVICNLPRQLGLTADATI